MGWIIATFGLLTVWVGTTWFLVHIIVKLVNQRIAFDEELEDRVDMSLRALDACYDQIVMVANKPVFFDSPEVRQVVKAIQDSRQAVVEVIEIFENIEVEENNDRAALEEIKYVSFEDPHNPKSNEQLNKESRDDLMRRARRGEVDVLSVQRSYGNPEQMTRQAVQPQSQSVSAAKAAAALARQTQRRSVRSANKDA